MVTLASCSKKEDTEKLGNWVIRAEYPSAREQAVSFVIGDTAYVGTGLSGASGSNNAQSDFWKYDPVKDEWTDIATMADPQNPGKNLARYGAIAFTATTTGDNITRGYVTTGFRNGNEVTGAAVWFNDTYEYDPTHNSWKEVAKFPGAARVFGVGFSLKGMGYAGTGSDNAGNRYSDFYMYDPNNNTWSRKNSMKDNRDKAVVFVIGDSAFIVTGQNSEGYATRMYVYRPDPVNEWAAKGQIINVLDDSKDDAYTTIARASGVGFAVNGRGYVAMGNLKNTWEYDPTIDKWSEKTTFEGTSRSNAVGFSIKGRGYAALGTTGAGRLVSTWAFDPSAVNDPND